MKQIKVSKRFTEDFELVAHHYDTPPEEVEWLKKQARSDYEMVKKSLAVIAVEIRTLGEVAA